MSESNPLALTSTTTCLGKSCRLPAIDVFNDNGTLNEAGGKYAGRDRFDVRVALHRSSPTSV